MNADLRGGGTSGGTGHLFSDEEARDYAELIQWAGSQSWCNGKVGLDGVSYLAISQYQVAGLGPDHLAAVCPWEGFSDLYRDWTYPGGVRERAFSLLWAAQTARSARLEPAGLGKQIEAHPERDEFYESRTPNLTAIAVPMLQCASFSDHTLHTRGSFEAFRQAGRRRSGSTRIAEASGRPTTATTPPRREPASSVIFCGERTTAGRRRLGCAWPCTRADLLRPR